MSEIRLLAIPQALLLAVIPEVLKNIKAEKSKILGGVVSELGENSEKEIQIIGVIENSDLENESEDSEQLDEILTQLYEADSHIAETRQNTVRLGIETRLMLDDLRKQLG